MARRRLTYSGASYFDSTRALERGEVTPREIDLTYLPVEDTSELFHRVANGSLTDVSEMSLSTYMVLRSRDDERLVGIPVFPSRAFRHRQIYVNRRAGIATPADLRGKNVGIPHYQMTAGLWVRGFLQHDFGVHPSEVHWWEGGLTAPDYEPRIEHRVSGGVRIDRIPSKRSLEEMLETGEIEALVSVGAPARLAESAALARLFENPRAVETDYYRRTGIVPIMHLVVIREDVYAAAPWVAVALLEAFEQSRLEARRRLTTTNALPLTHPWIAEEIDAIEQIRGSDPFGHGVEPNRAAIEAAAAFSFEQGLSERQLELADMFAVETLEWRSPA